MRRSCVLIIASLLIAGTFAAPAATGKVVKVLPHFLDLKGRHTLSPSLYDRDAYQAELRKHPEKRSGLRFDIQWRGRSSTNATGVLRLELRGTAQGGLPRETKLETTVPITGSGHWTALTLAGADYKEFGEVTAWHATLWVGEELLGEQKSFLW
jgi:hypothetical protein